MNRTFCRARRRLLSVALLAVVANGLPLRAGAASTPDFASLRRATPYVRLFTEAGNCAENRTANNLAGPALDAQLAQLTGWFTHFHGEASAQFHLGEVCRGASATTLAAKLSARGAWVSNYRNGSYVSQASATQPLNLGEAADLETRTPLSIATFWPGNAKPYVTGNDSSGAGRLSGALDAAATTVRVTSATADRPAGAPTTWPFVNSRGTGLSPGAHSTSTRDFVSWIRLDDEIAQIVADPVEAAGVVTLTVKRGLWGTAAAPHASATRVMSPVYIGSTNAASSDSNLAGGPNRNDAGYPLRYAIKIWQPGGYNWIADRIKATFGAGLQGYNTVWLDVSSCVQYNHADASGQPVFGWDDPTGTKLTRPRWGIHQKAKLAGLRAALPGVRFTGNSMGGLLDACTDDLMANAYDGGVLENWMKTDAGHPLDWAASMAQSYRIQAGNWPALYWVRWNYDFSGDAAQYKRFSYGSLLLAHRTSADRYQYGGAFGLAQPDDLYRWDWGAPRANPGGIAEVKGAGTELYRRDFANGMVLVNPSSGPITYNLGGGYYDVNRPDDAGNPSPVTSVTVPAKDAAFLLGPPVPAGTQSPTVGGSSPGPGSNPAPGSASKLHPGAGSNLSGGSKAKLLSGTGPNESARLVSDLGLASGNKKGPKQCAAHPATSSSASASPSS
jgi:hypothetical protein